MKVGDKHLRLVFTSYSIKRDSADGGQSVVGNIVLNGTGEADGLTIIDG
jgi:hypothetical protein